MAAAGATELPEPWVAIDGDDGIFYYNEETGESQWEPPVEDGSGCASLDDREQVVRGGDEANAETERSGCDRSNRSPPPGDRLDEEIGDTMEVRADPQVELVFHEAVLVPSSRRAASAIRVTVPHTEAVASVPSGAQATLSCCLGQLFVVERIVGHGAGDDSPEEGEAHLHVLPVDGACPCLEDDGYDGLLTVLLAGTSVEEALFSAMHVLRGDAFADGVLRTDRGEIYESVAKTWE
eukprot:TRINITY_DN7217_c0_g1_i2.p1 TRINITY_DN7217_c0_g1~~TRINITY_DN7217_c0_g1_i2.p1  ORF type:complete len:237 (-),score=56.36 TRINITY_DN7217_c0_g1_i2:72-782(-)